MQQRTQKNSVLSRLSLSFRLLSVTGLALVLSSLIGVVCIQQINKLVALTSDITETWMPNLQAVAEIKSKLQGLRSKQWELLAENDSTKQKPIAESIDGLRGELFIYNKTLGARISDPENQKAFDDYTASWDKYQELSDKWDGLFKENKRDEAAALLRETGGQIFAEMETSTAKLDELSFKGSQRAREDAQLKAKQTTEGILIASPLVFLLSLSIVFFLITRTSKRLSSLAIRLRDSAADVSLRGETLNTTASELSSATNTQASAVVETSASVDVIRGRIEEAVTLAQSTATAIQHTRERAGVGNKAITEVSQAMRAIENSNQIIMNDVQKSQTEMEAITSIMQSIGSKAQVINDIVFQTRLLSFNASVEAARAGENGKGFAVVAEEMGKLASVSGAAADDISKILDSSSKKVGEILDSMKTRIGSAVQSSTKSIQEGSHLTETCSKALNEILTAAEGAVGLANSIASASSEQQTSISEINEAVSQIKNLTNTNSTLADSTSSESSQLGTRAEELNQMVLQLETEVQGRPRLVAAAAEESAEMEKVFVRAGKKAA